MQKIGLKSSFLVKKEEQSLMKCLSVSFCKEED